MQLYKEEDKIEKKKENQKLVEKNKKLIKINEILKEENSNMQLEIEELKNKIKKNKENGKQNLNQGPIVPSYGINNMNNIGININNISNIIKNEKINIIRGNNRLSNQSKNPIELYLQPPLIGLNNIGAIDFMNSTLQCLSHTADLTNYFLSEKNENYLYIISEELSRKKELCLSKAYLELIKKLWNYNAQRTPFSPKNFMKTINEMNPFFKAGDAKGFIIFVLEQLHSELKKPIVNQINVNKREKINQYDRLNAFNICLEDFKKECSIISDVFFGFNETTNVCLNCKNNYNSKGLANPISYNYGIFNCIIIPLEEVKKNEK
jgi:ubiquitin C-terminal hydrolase